MKKHNHTIKILLALLLAGTLVCAGCSAGPENAGGSYDAPDSGAYYPSGESYLNISDNHETYTEDESMLTFSLKVDTASYTNVQRYLEDNQLPPKDAVRIEELINYFDYDEQPTYQEGPFSIYTEIGQSPFDSSKQIAFIRFKTDDIDKSDLPPSNLVFLIDTSGSMYSHDKLPLLKDAFSLLVENLNENDRVSIVTYAGSSAVVIDGASGADGSEILNAINDLEAGGSTAGAQGIQTAYEIAQKHFIEGGNNRVILATDGDFNVGISSVGELETFISNKRDTGVYLSILGFGTGNLKDDTMETLAKNGNGNYHYINSVATAEKVLVDEMASNLFTVAEDVKTQVEFNPQNVESYRLIGYENRMMDNDDFNDRKKDAGEIGAGTDVVVLFEITTYNGGKSGYKYSSAIQPLAAKYNDELFEVRVHYKDPGKTNSKEILLPVTYDSILEDNTSDFTFACSVAAFGHLLRDSSYSGDITIEEIIAMAEDSIGKDEKGYRQAYMDLLLRYEYSLWRENR